MEERMAIRQYVSHRRRNSHAMAICRESRLAVGVKRLLIESIV